MPNYSIPQTPTHDELADRWLQKNKFTLLGYDRFLRYQNGYWQEIDSAIIKQEILEILKEAKNEFIEPTDRLLKSVFELIKIQINTNNVMWNSKKNILVCNNGTLNLDKKALLPHSPDHHVTTGVDYDYDPTAKCPNFLKVLENLDIDVINFLQEFGGYCLTTSTQFEIAIWLLGPPGNGKSTFILGLQTMLGPLSCVIGLSNMEKSRFSLWDLPGKTLMVSPESPPISITVSDQLNSIISGEKITIEQKFHDPFEIAPSVKIIWGMNELPFMTSAGNGLFRRVKIVYFPPISPNQRDPKIKEGVKGEGAGILNWALEGYQRLIERGEFIIPSSICAAVDEYKLSMDITSIFISEECVLDSNLQTQASSLYFHYQDWCQRNGEKPKSNVRFARDLKQLGLIREKKRNSNYWIGVGLILEKS